MLETATNHEVGAPADRPPPPPPPCAGPDLSSAQARFPGKASATSDPASCAGSDLSSAQARRVLLLILVAAAALRLLLWSALRNEPLHIADEKDYNELAHNLVTRGEFGYSPDHPSSLRPPLFPALVAGVYWLAGLDNFAAVRLVLAGLSLGTGAVVFLLAREVVGRRVGVWAAGMTAFYPTLLGFNHQLLTEALFTCLLTGACLSVVLLYTRERLTFALLAGVLLGLAALTRSVVWLSPPLLAAYVLLTWRASWGRRLAAAVLLLAAYAAVLAPWSIRNTRLQQTFVAVDVMGGRNLMMGNYEHTPLYRSWDAISLQGDQSWIHVLRERQPAEWQTQGQLDKAAMREGLRFIRENPGLTAKRCLVKFLDFWGLEREMVSAAADGYFGEVPRPAVLGLAALIVPCYVAAVFLAIFGVVLTPPSDRRLHWFFLAVVVFITGLHTLVFGHSRYHAPLMPLVLLYAAMALLRWRELLRRWGEWRFATAAVACAALAVGWGWNLFAGDWERFARIFQ